MTTDYIITFGGFTIFRVDDELDCISFVFHLIVGEKHSSFIHIEGITAMIRVTDHITSDGLVFGIGTIHKERDQYPEPMNVATGNSWITGYHDVYQSFARYWSV